jgi:hypothetical protein
MMNELLESLVGKTLNLPKEQLAGILYEPDGTTLKADAIEKLVEIDAQRIKSIKDAHKEDLTRMHDDGYSKGKGESLSKWEKQIKEELGLETDTKGIDLIKEAIAKNSKVEMDEEKIKLHPKYLELERKLNNEYLPKAEYDKVKAEFDEFKQQIEVTKVNSVVKQDAVRVFRSLKPVLSKDPVKSTNQETDFVNKLTQFEYELQNDGNHVIKIGGKRLETANGYPISFADFVKSEASKYYDFEQQDQRGNAGNADNGGSGGNIMFPQSEREFLEMLANETDPAKAVALNNAWKAKNK